MIQLDEDTVQRLCLENLKKYPGTPKVGQVSSEWYFVDNPFNPEINFWT